jgi:L-erythro-3,5-diaminohexanoate dehydrogenase
MSVKQLEPGCPFGSHRVLDPKGALPQPARKLDNDLDRIWANEILVAVETLNVDSASFTQIKQQAAGDPEKVKRIILDIIAQRGKLQNPVTGSGGMFIGTVKEIGERLKDRELRVGDRIASLVSLSLTPLRVGRITEVKMEIEQVSVEGLAVLFESGVYAKLPEDIPPTLALAALDVCGAPAQAERLARAGDTVVILGATGKSGILCAYAAKKKIGPFGRLIGLGHSDDKIKRLQKLGLCDEVLKVNATDALACHREVSRLTDGRLADLVLNCVNVPDTEMASILMCRDRGTVYFFSMATSFTQAALGAEGVGKDVNLMIGNGYAQGHAELTLNILRESPAIRELYQSLYA